MFIQVRCEKHIKRVRPWIKDKLFKVLLSFTKIVFFHLHNPFVSQT